MTSTTSPTERVGRYQLLEPIGIGPSGSVSRAKVFGVAGFERQFAVKRFHGELTATAAMAAMLSAAARAYGSLEHPRIARMSEFGVAQGSTFTAVEYVLGLDALRLVGEARLAGVTLAAGGALALVSQAARAVGYAHGRGLTHLGLAPTNVIVTADGDIKITDFGILSATLPQRPIEVPRLTQRIPYLAPEQLANEATSAATDVFALGVLAYELVTGHRTFRGETPQQVASAIMAGPPAEPPLPRPIVRVLQRCLARSPFERFPDARALADALDAALRVAPVPGTRKDIGAQVKDTLDRLAALNEGQMSGMVALHLGTGPIRRLDESLPAPDLGEPPAYELGRPDASAFGAGATAPDLARPPMTVPGVPPPPIPVPPGLGGIPIHMPPSQSGAATLLGIGKSPPGIPALRPPRPPATPGTPSKPPAVPAAALRSGGRPATDLAIPIEPASAGAHIDAAGDGPIPTLDPSHLVALDTGPSDTAEAPARGDDASSPDETIGRPDAPVHDDDGATNGVADASDGASSDGAASLSTTSDPADAPADARWHALDQLDPSSRQTRPIPPATLAPLLFDPIYRPDDLDDAPAEREPALDQAWSDDHVNHGAAAGLEPANAAASQEPANVAHMAAAATEPTAGSRAATPPPTADPRLGQTILGFAAPLPLPRTATPASPASDSPDDEPPEDDLADMLLEGFRTAPDPSNAPAPSAGAASPGLHAWQRSSYEPQPDDMPPPPSPPLPPLPALSVGPPLAVSPPLPVDPQAPPYPAMTPLHPSSAPSYPQPEDAEQPPPQLPPPSGPMPAWEPPPPPPGMPASTMASAARPPRMTWILVGMIGAAIVGIGAWQLYAGSATPDKPTSDSGKIASPPGDSRVAAAPADAAQPADANRTAAVPSGSAGSSADKQVAAPANAPGAIAPDPRVTAVTPGSPGGTGDSLSIASTPPGARVFLDGSDTGATPVKLPGSPDRHTIALLLAGHELYIAQVDGHGTFQIPLKEVTPTNGPAGIKVLRCKDKDRYYVYIDGKHTGQTCPTERIGCEIGPHTVEVYDVVSETRRKWEIVVKDTRLSFRVRVE